MNNQNNNNFNQIKTEENVNKKTAPDHEKILTSVLKNKNSNNDLGKTSTTEAVRQYNQFKYKIKKNKYLELIPQISLYFHDLDENKGKEFFKNDGLEKLRSELNELVGEDGYNYFW